MTKGTVTYPSLKHAIVIQTYIVPACGDGCCHEEVVTIENPA